MVTPINRTTLLRLIEDGGQVVDVLPEWEFARSHIPGAVNIPLKKLGAKAVAKLDRDKPTVVYCHDGL